MVARFVIRLVLSLGLVLAGVVLFAVTASAATGTSDISVAKTGPTHAQQGDIVTYTIAVTNNGPDDATNVFVDDSLPAGETFAMLIPNTGCTTPPQGGGGLVECVIPTLTAGITNSFTLGVQIGASVADGTLIRNTAVVQADQTDPVPSSNSSTLTTLIGTPQTDIAMTKSGPATAQPGDSVTYTIELSNNGPDPAVGPTMTDVLPAADSFQSFDFGAGTVVGTSCSLPAPGGGGAVRCTTPSLASGQTETFLIHVQVLAVTPDATVVTNTATAAPGPNQVDPDPGNNTASSTLTVVLPDKDLAITPGVSPAPVQATSAAGAPVTFSVPTASDEDGTVPVVCDATSGSIFPVGSTTVHCSATDADDTPSTATTSLTVTVIDTDLAITPGVSPAPVQATSAAGAPVSFTIPTASDEDGTVPVVCDATSGSIFPVGSTTVHCSATDADDTPSTVTTTLTVTVVDKDLALAGVPSPITANATSPAGATVTYKAPTATDEEAPPAVTCDHASGSTFPIGTTTVTCTATDTDDTPSTVQATFTVKVVGVAGRLQSLLGVVQPLPPGTSLPDKVQEAISFFSAGDNTDTCTMLAGVVSEANAQSGKKLTAAQAAQIAGMAKQIEAVIPCP